MNERNKGMVIHKNLRYLILISILVLMCGCSRKTNNQNKNISDISDIQLENELKEDDSFVQNGMEDSELIPEFLDGYFDMGTYPQPIRIPDLNDNYEKFEIVNDRIVFPELVVLSVIVERWGEPSIVYTQNNEKIRQFMQALQRDIFTSDDTQISDWNNHEQDSEIAVTILKVNGMYALIKVRSSKDNFIEIEIEQEDGIESYHLCGYSEIVHNNLREMCNVETIDRETFLESNNICYSIDGNQWIDLSVQDAEKLKTIIGFATTVKNYSFGCPFDLKFKFENGNKQYTGRISTDNCGIIILGDTTFQLQEKDRVVLGEIFGFKN